MSDNQALEQTRCVLENVVRGSRARLVAFLASRSGDLAGAEDALSEAFASALSVWPEQGCPVNPEAWLLTVARRKLIDRFRTDHEVASSDEMEEPAGTWIAVGAEPIPDRRLALLFACANPAIDSAVRAPLMLQAVLGLEAAQIASAFLVSPAAMAQRLVRAKTKIREARIPFEIPDRSELPDRLDGVLDSIYACYAEGWTEATGADMERRELATEAIFLGKMIVELVPDEPESWGLLALMLFAESRRSARRSPEGDFIPFAQQNRALWDKDMIDEAETALRRASEAKRIGRFQLEAAIQSAHVEGASSGIVPWSAIFDLYDALVQLTGSPVAAMNRALALGELHGTEAGLKALESVNEDPRIRSYQPYWAARAHLLSLAGAHSEARHAYEVAAGLAPDPAIRKYLQQLRDALPE